MTTVHAIHAGNDDTVLFDDCPRCTEHAETILYLDASNLRRLWDRMSPWNPRTVTEAQAMRKLEVVKLVMEKLEL